MAVKNTNEIDWHELFYYDETSPSCLRRKTEWRSGRYGNTIRASIGDAVTSLQRTGYFSVRVGGKSYLCHRIIQEMFYGALGRLKVDHVDRDRTNNKIGNLRRVVQVLNCRNITKRITNSSGKTGVSLRDTSRPTGSSSQWTATWRDAEGKQRNKSYSVNKYGYDLAFNLACEYRDKMILKLNSLGAGYTESHGESL